MAKVFPDTNIFVDALHRAPEKQILENLEDNIQLHSAAEAECDFFLTSDDKLLKIKFFGKTEIKSGL